jgi:hypothetical protein
MPSEPMKPGDAVGRPKSAAESRTVKITVEAYDAARIASGFTGDTIVDLVSRLVKESCEIIIDQEYARRRGLEEKPKKK